jgi:hypothetical protein
MRRGAAWPGAAWRGMAGLGEARCFKPKENVLLRGLAGRGLAWHGLAGLGRARRGDAGQGEVLLSASNQRLGRRAWR